MWTFEYTVCYLIGPLIGAFVAGTVFNYVTQTMEDMEYYGEQEEDEVDPPVVTKIKAKGNAEDDV